MSPLKAISNSALEMTNLSNLVDERSREIFKTIVESYLQSGDPLGSRVLAKQSNLSLSPATIRNVMADLEQLGLIYAPHTSAGRLPTDLGLRYFVDGVMEFGDLTNDERSSIEAKVKTSGEGQTLDGILTHASTLLSGLTKSAGLVVTGNQDLRLKHIEFLRLEPTKALVVIVGENGKVENRVIDMPAGITASTLVEASNYLNAHIAGHSLSEAKDILAKLHLEAKRELDQLAQSVVDKGLATWAGTSEDSPARLIVRGRANLLEDLSAMEDLERVKLLFSELESKEGIMRLLDLTETGEGVRIFIGSENKLFSLSGSSIVVAPYHDSEQRIIGAVGVIGPTRLDYARIVPMVDFTAQVVSKMLK